MDKVIVIRHSDEELPNTKYTANVKKNEDGSYFNKSMPLIIKRGLPLPENNTVIDFAGFPMISGNVKGDKDYRRIVLYVEDWTVTAEGE